MKALKHELEKIEKKILPDDEIHITVYWRKDGLHEWHLPDGSIELISEEEYLKRGGRIIRYAEDEAIEMNEEQRARNEAGKRGEY